MEVGVVADGDWPGVVACTPIVEVVPEIPGVAPTVPPVAGVPATLPTAAWA
jgi:hypothetical protein